MKSLLHLLYLATPVHALASPVFSREMAVTGRRWTTYGMRSLFVLGVLGIVSIAFIGNTMSSYATTQTEAIDRAATFAPQVAVAIVWVIFVSMIFLGPLLSAGVICDEKTARTLPSLLSTPLTTTQIVFGKIASRFAHLCLLVLSVVPILLFVRVYGGYSIGMVLKGVTVALSCAFLGLSVGLMFSVWHKRSWSVMIYAILFMGGYMLIPMVLFGVAMSGWNTTTQDFERLIEFVLNVSPPVVLIFITSEADAFMTGSAQDMRYAWLWCSLFTLGVGWLIGLYSSVVLRRVMLAESHGWQAGTGGFIPGAGIRGRGKRKAKATRTERTSSRVVGGKLDLPVFWRDRRVTVVKSRAMRALIVLLSAGLLSLFYIQGDYREVDTHMMIMMIVLTLVLATAATVTTNAITSEREARSLDVLLTTPMTVRSIVFQKYWGNLVRLMIAPLFLLVHFLVFGLLGIIDLWFSAHVFMVTVGYASLLVGSGLLCGALLKRSATASIANMSFALSIWMGLPIMFGIMMGILGAYDGSFLQTVAITINPFYLLFVGLDAAMSFSSQTLEYGSGSNPISRTLFHAIVAASSGIAMLTGLAFAGLAALTLRLSYRRME